MSKIPETARGNVSGAAGSGKRRASPSAVGRARKRGGPRVRFLRSPLPEELRPDYELTGERPTDARLLSWVRYYVATEVYGVGSERTQDNTLNDLKNFMGYFHELYPDGALSRWDKGTTQSFIRALERRGLAVESVRKHLTTLKSLAHFMIEEGVHTRYTNPTRRVKPPDRQPLKPRGLRAISSGGDIVATGDEVFNAMVDIPRALIGAKGVHQRAKPFRDVALLYILAKTGMRVDEVCKATFEQLDPRPAKGEAWINGVRGKGNRFRNVYVHPAPYAALKAYLDSREWDIEKEALIQGDKGHLHRGSVWAIVKKYAMKAAARFGSDVVIPVHPHSFRHERAHFLLNVCGYPESFVAEQLGHANLDQLRVYTKRDDEETAKILRRSE